MDDLTPDQVLRVKRLASGALVHARFSDLPSATVMVNKALEEFSYNGLILCLMLWADTVAEAQGLLKDGRGKRVTPVWNNTRTGKTTRNADEVAAPGRWAGRFLAARAARDHDLCEGLIQSIADHPEQFTATVNVMLAASATTLNNIAARAA
ncbi:MAG: hypothetical protein JWO67_6237 [Streptosporangiaceae bacterium]|nr:hypothetical protein [Streptosporangiaceae bacterium]